MGGGGRLDRKSTDGTEWCELTPVTDEPALCLAEIIHAECCLTGDTLSVLTIETLDLSGGNKNNK